MTKKTPPDIEERKMIAEELDINFLVEAGAGSGKTSSLVNRMINLIKAGKYTAGEMAAITFTRKAAAELRDRFQDSLEAEFRKDHDTHISQRITTALLNLDQCYLGTIHSFCSRLLRERPVEAGLDPEFTEVEEVENRALMEQSWQRHLVEVKLYKPHLLENLRKIGVTLQSLQRGYYSLLNYPDLNLIYTRTEKPDLTPALESLKILLYKAKPSIPNPPLEDKHDELQLRILKALRHVQYFDLNNPATVANLLSVFARANHKITQKLWYDKSTKEFQSEFNALSTDVIIPTMERWQEYCHFHVMEFLLPGVESFTRVKEKESKLNFQDLLMKTSRMLRDYPEVRSYFQERYKCLLIDEFQDTDPIQSEVMFYLTGSDLHEKDWQNLIPRAGSLFVVGDPKQSIYRFRRADIDTYNLVKEVIGQNGGRVIHLTANFRSLKSLGEYCNAVFKDLLADHQNPYQALYQPMSAQRDDPTGVDFGVKLIEIPDHFKKKEEIIKEDSRRIASYIRNALDGQLPIFHNQPKDFLILLRYKDSMEAYARALEELNIPVIITGGSSLKSSVEAEELLQVLKLLADPANQLLLAAVLRGMFFGLSDDELYRFKQGGGTFNIFNPIPAGLEEDLLHTFTDAYSRLKAYYHYTRTLLPTVALEKILGHLGLLPFALTEPLGRSKGGLILQVLEHLRKAEAEGVTTFAGLVATFETLKEAGLEDELDLSFDGQNAVRLMNLHKAKGLEAPVVFLAHPFKNVRFDPDLHVSRVGNHPGGYFAFMDEFSKRTIAQPLNWQEYQEEEARYQAAEETRLIYVAATRARDLLIISRSLKDAAMTKNPWSCLIEKAAGQVVPAPRAPSPISAGPKEDVSLEDLLKARREFSAWIPGLAAPSYETYSPSTSLKDFEGGEIRRVSGGGVAWGSVIHRVLEETIRGEEDLESFINLALTEYGLPLERKSEVLSFLETMKKSPLWQRIEKAEVKLAEVPFTYKVDPHHKLAGLLEKKEVSQLISGVIDLVFKEGDEWVIVDYKTDRVEDEESLLALTEKYAEQVMTYVYAFEDLVGEKVKAAEIYYLHMNESRKVYGSA